MKKVLVLVFILTSLVVAQTEYVNVDNPVYDFLERMETQQIINNYNSFEIPKTRKVIAGYLKQVLQNENMLDNSDTKLLEDLKVEFEFELYETTKYSESVFGNDKYDLLNQKEKYLYYYVNPGKANIFINLLGEGEFINRNISDSSGKSTLIGVIGGEIRGTFLNKFGFGIHGTNGNVFGNRTAALARKDIKYNYKFNENPSETFFDETAGYLTADFDAVKFKIGRDRMNVGYGVTKSIIASNSPLFDYISFKINYDFFNFSYFHGKLLGPLSYDNDTITGGSARIEEKYVGYHRIGFNFSRDVDFGVGELIIYGDRSLDLSYLNPFNFYKSVEHANQDRDNSMLFIDFNNNSIKGLKLFGTFLIDDMQFGQIGKGWWGNETMFNVGVYSTNLYNILPLDIHLEYLRIEPYTFSHRLIRNAFTNFGYNLGPDIQPNTGLFFSQINYRFNNRLSLTASFSYSEHGANPVMKDGTIRNVGGDIMLGHRLFDSERVTFLDGDLQYSRNYSFSLFYEPVNQIKFSYVLNILNRSFSNNETISFLNLSVKL